MNTDLRRPHCLACKARLSEKPLLTLEGVPASAQDIPDASQVENDRGIPLSLHQCPNCGLVQFDCQPVEYYRDVIRSGGFSTTMVELRRRQYRHLIETYDLQGKKILEAGCGRGEFLLVLREFPVLAYGIEHKEDLVEIAQKDGLSVWRQFPETEDTVIENLQKKPPYDAFLSFNFLEHQPEPDKMLRCIRNNLVENGLGLVTVPSLEYILKYNGYYELIRDHLAYYTFDTLKNLMERNGFEVLEEEMVNRDTLSVIVKKTDLQNGKGKSREKAGQKVDLTGLMASRQSIDREVNHLVDSLHKEGKSLAVWGASHQGFTLAATTRLGHKVQYMMDSAPFKQGRFAPASHIPIVAPDYFLKEPVDAVLIVAPGYTDEIAQIIRTKYACGPSGETTRIYTLRTSQIEDITVPEETSPKVGQEKVVITGATGFIGSNLASLYLEKGNVVYALVRPDSPNLDRLPIHKNLIPVFCDLEHVSDCVEEIGQADAFFHLAWGGVNRQEIDSQEVQKRNTETSLECVKAAARLKCRVFMDAGSRVEYGITKDGVMQEDMECHPVNEYGKAKLSFYKQAAPLCKQYGMTYFHLRFFSVYGPKDHPWSIISTLTRDLPGDKTVSLSACLHRWNFMYIKDAAEAVYKLHQSAKHIKPDDEKSGMAVNIASQDTRVLKEFVEEIHELAKGRGKLEYGTFIQAKEGALSVCPDISRLKSLTKGAWKEQYTFCQGIEETMRKEEKKQE